MGVGISRAVFCAIAAAIAIASPAGAHAQTDAPSPAALIRRLGPAEVDWGTGLVFARASAVANLHLPGPEAIRAAAVREASDRARLLLRQALRKLSLGPRRRPSPGAITAALPRARILEAEYHSNGGVRLKLGLSFADLAGAPPPAGRASAPAPDPLLLSLPSMPLEAAPIVVLAGKEMALRQAVYRLGPPPRQAKERPLAVRRDRQGRLTVSRRSAGKLPETPTQAVIYLRRVGGG